MTRGTTVSTLALIALAGPSFAEVTANEVWDNLTAYMADMGYEVTATETDTARGLSLSDVTYSMDLPEDDGRLTVTAPDMLFANAGDGSVDITLPETSEMTISVMVEDADDVVVSFDLTQSGLLVNASGDADKMTYAMTGESIGMVLAEVVEGGEALPPEVLRGQMSMGPLDATAVVAVEDGARRVTQDVSYGDVSYDLSYQAPEDEGDSAGMLRGKVTGLAGAGEVLIPEGAATQDPAAMFESGFGVDASVTHTGGETEFDFDDGSDRVSGTMTSTGGEIGMSMSRDKMVYAVKALGQAINLRVPDMPFPIEGEIAEAGLSFELPLAASDTPQPLNLSVLLEDFTMADMLWNLFDPQQQLPRDPATIGANVQAQVTPFVSLLDEEALAKIEAEGAMPGELNEVTLSDVVVRAIGAELLGKGAFTFDNTDLESFGGMPAPEGQVDLQIAGINGLIDRLIAMGFVQEQDAMGARLMLGMFTVPGAEPDTATATIEINDQGHILANGQRIK
ncbi:DUF2125 domain-containing protein [Sagittula sp. SSi028]|uniref:DUF2125 domain-containing protein n=1 Tax=Sagittula sp. SSi028 TaxID=3400636 RepID=UPI003AF8D82B